MKKITNILILLLPFYCSAQNVKSPKKVYLNYAVNQLTNIDYVNQTFEIDFYFQQYWKLDSIDKKHITPHKSVLKDGAKIDPQHLTWLPKNDFTNVISIELIGDLNYWYIDNHILFDVRYKATFYNKMDLKEFPFDNQDLTIHLEDFSKTTDELVFLYGSPFEPQEKKDTCFIPSKSAFETDTDFPEFYLNDLVKAISTEHTYNYTKNPQTYSELRFVLNTSRKKGFYFTKVISISLLIVIMSWIVFSIDPTDLQGRIGYSISAFLALTAHNFVINELLPMISYLTTMDYIVLGTNILVFFTVLESLIVARITHAHTIQKAKKIDFYSFLASITFFFCLTLFTFIKSYTNASI